MIMVMAQTMYLTNNVYILILRCDFFYSVVLFTKKY